LSGRQCLPTLAGRAVEKYADTVRRICFIHLKNHTDVEDVFQDVFLKYLQELMALDTTVAVDSCRGHSIHSIRQRTQEHIGGMQGSEHHGNLALLL
jgi:hypothetical protein